LIEDVDVTLVGSPHLPRITFASGSCSVAQAAGETGDPLVVEALLEACNILEVSSKVTPLVAIERRPLRHWVYHLFVWRLSTSIPRWFQILISRELASGLIY